MDTLLSREGESTLSNRTHALLSASAAHRWMNCPPSALACDAVEEAPSPYADEGTLAHAICERKLVEKYGLPFTDAQRAELAADMERLKARYAPEMEAYTDAYVDYVAQVMARCSDRSPRIFVELRVDYSAYAPGGFGTADCVVADSRTLHIIDFKYGKGVRVDPRDNPQLKLYALGAYDALEYAYSFEAAALHIVQPRIGGPRMWGVGIDALLRWGERMVRPLATLAAHGNGWRRAGGWCRFCKVKGGCRDYARMEAEREGTPAACLDCLYRQGGAEPRRRTVAEELAEIELI